MTPTIETRPSGAFLLKSVIGAYPSLYKATTIKNIAESKPRFGITVLVPKSATEVIADIKKSIATMAKDKLKIAKLAEADSCFRDGDENSNENFHGFYVLSLYKYPNEGAARGGAPDVVDAAKVPIPQGAPNEPISGDIVNVLFDLYTPSKWKKVSGGLKAVQFMSKGTFIGAGSSASEFDEAESDSSEVDDDL
jgi:hypothetical protein